MAIKEIIDPEQFEKDVVIGSDLNASFRDQGSLFAHYATLHRQALEQVAQKKLMAEVKKSVLYKEIRETFEKDGKKITEALLEAEINSNRDYIGVRMELIKAEGIAQLAKNALESFSQRKDMLVQLGADARQEATAELRMMGPGAAIAAWKEKFGTAAST